MLGKILVKSNPKRLQHGIAKTVASSFGIKVLSLGLAFVTNILLARLLGADGYGAFIYAFTWANFLAILPSLGLTEYVIRQVAIYQSKSEWKLLKGLMRWSNSLVLVLSIIAAILATIVAWFFGIDSKSPTALVFWLALATIPVWNLTRLRQETMKGFNKVVLGDFPELLIRPILFLVLIAIAYLTLGGKLDVTQVMGFHVLSVVISFGVGAWLLFKILPKEVKLAPPTYEPRLWFYGTLPFLLIVCMFTINQQTDVLMLGAIKGPDAAGIYTVVCRGVQIIQFALAAVSATTGPTIAALYAVQDIPKLKQVIQQGVRLLLVGSFIMSGALILFGQVFLSIFGPEFVEGQLALTVLSIGYFLDASIGGLAGLLLLMTGNEQDTALGTGVTAGLNVVLNALLIPQWGLTGAAIATTVSILCRSAFFVLRSHQKLGFFPNPL